MKGGAAKENGNDRKKGKKKNREALMVGNEGSLKRKKSLQNWSFNDR